MKFVDIAIVATISTDVNIWVDSKRDHHRPAAPSTREDAETGQPRRVSAVGFRLLRAAHARDDHRGRRRGVFARRLKALADPVRLRLVSIVAASEGQEACVCDLIEPVGLSQPAV